MSTSSRCTFCELPASRIIDHNGSGVVIRDAFPVSPGHTLVIAHRHVGSFFDLTAAERHASAGYGGAGQPVLESLRVGGNLCIDALVPGEEGIRHISDDQSIVTGHALDMPGIGFVAPEQCLAREVARRLFVLVRSPLGLCPDGKALLVLEEVGERRGATPGSHHDACRGIARCAALAGPGRLPIQCRGGMVAQRGPGRWRPVGLVRPWRPHGKGSCCDEPACQGTG